jgi:cytidylate kinase
MIIALDGPSGAGKSTIAKAVAARLGYSCLDTGAMYRCMAWWALEHDIPLDDAERIGAIAREKPIAFEIEAGNPAPKRVLVDGIDVTGDIRTGRIDRSVSAVSSIPAVREALVDQQRRIGKTGDYVVEGRDIGTAVFPDAEVKVFMTASAEERARRRVLQNKQRGIGDTDYDSVLADIIRRDELDSTRDTSPLRPADDAIQLDTSEMSIEEVIDFVCNMAKGVSR